MNQIRKECIIIKTKETPTWQKLVISQYYYVFSLNPLPTNVGAWQMCPEQPYFNLQLPFQNCQFSNEGSQKQGTQMLQSSASERNAIIQAQGKDKNQQNGSKSSAFLQNQRPLQSKKKCAKKIAVDQDFDPEDEEPKKTFRAIQNSNRNVIPNIIHQVIAFVFKKNRSGPIVEKLIPKLTAQKVSVKRYYTYMLLAKQKINTYVNIDSLAIFSQMQDPNCHVYSGEEQSAYMKISRILVQYFFTHEFDTINLTSKKMKSNKRIDHLQIKREIMEHFDEVFSP